MLTRRQLVTAIAGGGAITIVGYSTTTDNNRETGGNCSTPRGPISDAVATSGDSDIWHATAEKLPKTCAFAVEGASLINETDTLLLTIDVNNVDKIDTLTVRNENEQIHSERINSTGRYQISLNEGYTTPATITIEARGDGSVVGTHILSTEYPNR